MAANGTRLIAWQGGEHNFCLAAAGDIFTLEANCKAGIAGIHRRLLGGEWFLNDIRETIRLGLIGGGMAADDAMQLIKSSVDANPRGLAPSIVVAIAVLEAVIIGVPDDPVGKNQASEAKTQGHVSSTTTAASGAQPSTESAPASAGRRVRPTRPRSSN